jgi:hypothetical protein
LEKSLCGAGCNFMPALLLNAGVIVCTNICRCPHFDWAGNFTDCIDEERWTIPECFGHLAASHFCSQIFYSISPDLSSIFSLLMVFLGGLANLPLPFVAFLTTAFAKFLTLPRC